MSDYTLAFEDHDYRAMLEMSHVSPDMMTDIGLRASDLAPIGDAVLTPGDPSPLGCDPESGDLAYPVYPDHEYVRLARTEAADLACLLAQSRGIHTWSDTIARAEPLLHTLLEAACPAVLFSDSAHEQMQLERLRGAVLRRGRAGLSERSGTS